MAKNNRGKAGSARSSRSPFVVLLIVGAVVGVGIVGYAVSSDSVGSVTALAPVEIEGLDDRTRLIELAQGVPLGDPDATIEIWEFGDYQCPGCRFFYQQVKPHVELNYVNQGLAKFIYFDFPLGGHPHAFVAARAARCAGDQDQYWPYHGVLFERQPDWSISTAAPIRMFIDYAQALGLDRREFEGCLRSDRHAEVVTANKILAEELALPGTPSVLIVAQGQRLPWRLEGISYEDIAEAVDSLRAIQAQQRSEAGDQSEQDDPGEQG